MMVSDVRGMAAEGAAGGAGRVAGVKETARRPSAEGIAADAVAVDGAPEGQRAIPLELLAPAGGPEQLAYAIRFGADAVYLATDRFGMRKRASNFTCDDLPRVVAYAHGRGVAVHVACNVVMGEADVAELPAYLELVEAAGADALIVSDLGALRLARRHAPHVKVHVSTQASVANADAALVWHELGASRIVCAREMSVAQIAAMRSRIPDDLELEAFAHGSMCMAYSGRCLISDYLTGRAANGGSCTQPCRWAWELHEPSRPGQAFPVEEDPAGEDGRGGATYLFNSCDLNMLAHLDDLAEAGVDAVKLEGRGRKAFYTATVVGAYRRVLDGEPAESVASELEKISHHPYSTGFYYGPAHQAPASAASGSEWLWAAEVLECRELPGGGPGGAESGADGGLRGGRDVGRRGDPFGWEAEAVARNRFEPSDELEVLSPGIPARRLRISDVRWVHDDGVGGRVAESVAAASRQMDRYRFACDAPLRAGDIVRVRRG